MIEIKFRAWVDEKMQKTLTIREIGLLGYKISDNAILMQYTGLKDKNGVEIYEGDIIKIEKCFTNGVDKLSDHIGEIKYLNCRFMATDEYLNSLCPYTYKNQIEVIGNIYENPELLRED